MAPATDTAIEANVSRRPAGTTWCGPLCGGECFSRHACRLIQAGRLVTEPTGGYRGEIDAVVQLGSPVSSGQPDRRMASELGNGPSGDDACPQEMSDVNPLERVPTLARQ